MQWLPHPVPSGVHVVLSAKGDAMMALLRHCFPKESRELVLIRGLPLQPKGPHCAVQS